MVKYSESFFFTSLYGREKGMNIKDLRINGARLRETLEEMAKIGATPNGGVQRLALSDEDKQARDLFVSWGGNNNSLSPVMSGSHIDSQPKGDRFDGILGVMGALEVLRTSWEDCETEANVLLHRILKSAMEK